MEKNTVGLSGSPLPFGSAEISPFFGTHFHDYVVSPMGRQCRDLNVSIHDRYVVHEKLKRVEQEMLFGREAK